MIHTGTLLRAELYNDYTGKSSVVTVYNANKGKHPGKLIVTNGHWWDPGPKPCGNYKVDGKVLSTEDWMDWGFGWNTGSLPMMVATMGNDNYVSTLPVLLDGKEHNNSLNNDTSGVRRTTLRTWFGVNKAGKWTVEVTTSYYTLTEITKRMLGLGIVDGMVLDGSGSSQWYDGKTRLKGDGRTIYSYLLCWFEEQEDEPTDTVRRGIDVSDWQGEIDWERVKASGVEFVMLKCGAGQSLSEEYFKRNADECTRLGIPFGVYFFSYAYNVALAKKEAKRCLDIIKGYKLSYPVAWDYEYDSYNNAVALGIKPTRKLVSDMGRAFLAEIEAAGYYAMLYANPDYISRYFDADLVSRYDTWLASWYSEGVSPERKPAQAGGLWQYWNQGRVDGISGDVDLNYAYYDYPALIGYTPEPEKPEQEDKPMTWQEEQKAATEWAKSKGISDGERPEDAVKRVELWVTLWRMFGGEK